MIKLNLGCGIYYKPGYINIDKFESDIADETTDISHLIYKNNSVDEIQASHIIEHFDSITIPFLIAEWFRVLKPNSKLVIEAPSFKKGYLKLLLQRKNKKRNVMRFLFGIDLPGNVHKIGLTPKYIKKILISTGFIDLKSVKPQNFKDQKSFRIQAKKPKKISQLDKQGIVTCFRWKIYNEFKELDVLFLDSVEKNCISIVKKSYDYNNRDFFSKESIISLIASLTLFNPKIAKILLSLLPKVRTQKINIDFLNYLKRVKSPTIFLSLWMKWKKEKKGLITDYTNFQDYWISRISKILIKSENFSDTLKYFSKIKGENCEYFSLELIDLKALKLTNLGIKSFSSKKYKKSKSYFEKSLKFVPNSVLNNWNLARLSLLLNERKYKTLNYYQQALTYEKNKKNFRILKNEINNFQTKIEVPKQIRY